MKKSTVQIYIDTHTCCSIKECNPQMITVMCVSLFVRRHKCDGMRVCDVIIIIIIIISIIIILLLLLV